MSDSFPEWLEDNPGKFNGLAQFAAVSQRNALLTQQRQTADAIKKQTAVLEEQNRIEKDRHLIEKKRLELEKQRIKAEENERSIQKQKTEQIRGLRNLLANVERDLVNFRKSI